MTEDVTRRHCIEEFSLRATKMLGRIAEQSDDFQSFEAAWGSALFILMQIAGGNFHGTLSVEIKGMRVLPVRIEKQTVNLSAVFDGVYDGIGRSGIPIRREGDGSEMLGGPP